MSVTTRCSTVLPERAISLAPMPIFSKCRYRVARGDIIDLDALSGRTLLGYIYGGIAAGSPNGGFSGDLIATAQVFTFEYVPVPEPAARFLLSVGIGSLLGLRRWQHR
jgi:hypothetical protein